MPAPLFIGLALVLVAAATAWAATAPAWAGPAGDRLDPFREIVATRPSAVEDTGGALGTGSSPRCGEGPSAIRRGSGSCRSTSNRGRVDLRYEIRYPGWKPGCDLQAEQEDRYRADPGGGLMLVSRQLFNGWHRELQRSATRLFSALASGDRKALAELAPDVALRARLPVGLLAETVCDSQNRDPPGTAVVAAAEPLPDGRRAPWSLWWSRGPSGWRLTGAAPVL